MRDDERWPVRCGECGQVTIHARRTAESRDKRCNVTRLIVCAGMEALNQRIRLAAKTLHDAQSSRRIVC